MADTTKILTVSRSWALPVVLSIAILFSEISSPWALLLGMFMGLAVPRTNPKIMSKAAKQILAIAIVGLGAQINLIKMIETASHTFLITLLGVSVTMALGWMMARAIGIQKHLGILISAGTAICGGSAIAAVASTLNANDEDISISLSIVFLLNAVALFTFPTLGHWFGLSQEQFGMWSALSIHDTASVVASAAEYGGQSLQIATTLKLTRSLWIIPLCVAIAWFHQGDSTKKSSLPSFPKFIIGFVLMSVLFTYAHFPEQFAAMIGMISRRLLVLAIFWIGAQMTMNALKKSGSKAILLGTTLWVIILTSYLAFIKNGWI